jgi:CheY-like chemotaxis protein
MLALGLWQRHCRLAAGASRQDPIVLDSRIDRAMPLPILVVDDSPMARKMLIKSLPPWWDIEITQAGNGIEAMEHYRAGKADVMFLDLTMPEMDGYQVLEALQKEDLNSMVIVVSADIQPQAQERVMNLGAIAFVKKPVSIEKLLPILRSYGLVI